MTALFWTGTSPGVLLTTSRSPRSQTPRSKSAILKGKIIAATNHDLTAEMHAGRFRHDHIRRSPIDSGF